MAPPEKAWITGALLYAGLGPGERGAFRALYRDAKMAWGKRVHIERFITNKTYSLAKEGSLGIDFLSEKKIQGIVQLNMVPARKQKVKSVNVDLAKIPACGLTARGVKLTPALQTWCGRRCHAVNFLQGAFVRLNERRPVLMPPEIVQRPELHGIVVREVQLQALM